MANEAAIEVEVAYALHDQQELLRVEVPAGATLEQAIVRSGLLERHPEIDLQVNKVGVFGKACSLTTPLQPGDRVEIYRPLIADPKEARKKRAAEGKVMRKGAGAESEG